MGLLDDLLYAAEGHADLRQAVLGEPADHGGLGVIRRHRNQQLVEQAMNAMLNERFKDVLKGHRIQVRAVWNERTRVTSFNANLVLDVPFSLNATEEALVTNDTEALIRHIGDQTGKLSEHLVAEIGRMLTGRPTPPRPAPNLLVPAIKHPDAKPLEEPIPDMPFGKDD